MNEHAGHRELSQRNRRHAGLRLVRPQDSTYALGLSVEVTARYAAFGNISLGEWLGVLSGQIERSHYYFVIDERNAVVGFVSWALAHESHALAWLERGKELYNENCSDGDCVILNAWIAESPEIQRFMIKHTKQELSGKRFIFAKRIYPQGRIRAVKLPVGQIGEDRSPHGPA